MRQAEQMDVPYLFKLRLTKGTRTLVERLMRGRDWVAAGQGWEGAESTLRLTGWSRSIVVLRRRCNWHDSQLAGESPAIAL